MATEKPLLCELLARQVRDQGGRTAVFSESGGRAFTFAELSARADAWAKGLAAAGVRPGRLVGLATGNAPAFIELFFALRSLGAPVLLLDDGLAPAAADAVARQMRVSWLVHRDGRLGGEAPPAAPDPSVRLSRFDEAQAPPEGTALVKLTSGSTLRPRGACFTEEALVEGIDHIGRGMELTRDDRVIISIPLSHSYGFDNGVLSLAALGTPLVLQPDVLPAAMLATLRGREVTFFPAVPALVRALAQVPWPKPLALRRVICASAPLPRETAERFAAASGLAVHQFFGATESGGITFETRPADPAAEGTVGFPLPGVRVELEDGLVRVRSKANRFALWPAEGPPPSGVETGDRACFTAEGRLRLLGRAQLVANIGGIKVDLGAIDAFFRGLPGVGEAVTLAVDDPARGHRLVACVESLTQDLPTLLEICRGRLSPREVPSEIRIVERLPRTPRGKPDRDAILESMVPAPPPSVPPGGAGEGPRLGTLD
jgi:acyl-CoA synthetase (AMP-forming)/AMP-acid ligase II